MYKMMKRYRIVKSLAIHHHVCTDLVEDQITGKLYVAKSVLLHQALPVEIHQLKQEIQVLSCLTHTHVPVLVDVIEDQKRLVLIESYLDGSPLSQVSQWKQIRYRKRWLKEIMHLLKNLHESGYLYIDLKPENLMICHNHIYLIDFNACILLSSTKVYMASDFNQAPECKSDVQKEATTDVYALGALAKKLYPVGHKFWIRRCMHKDTHKRFGSMDQAMKGWVWFGWMYQVLCFLCISLSVFFMIQNRYIPSPVEEYENILKVQSGSLDERIQNAMQIWISQEPEPFQDSEEAHYFIRQSMMSNDPSVVEFIYRLVPESLWDTLPISSQLERWFFKSDAVPAISVLHSLLHSIRQEENLLSRAAHLLWLERLLIQKEIVLDNDGQEQLDRLHREWSEHDMENNRHLFLELACLHGEYLLFLHSKENFRLVMPEVYVSAFAGDDQFDTICEMNRRVK